jgi:hypothetical protein
MHEETGYCGVAVGSSPIVLSDPALCNASFRFVQVNVDVSAAENAQPKQRLEGGEDMAVEVLLPAMEHLAREQGLRINARCYALALGMSFGQLQLNDSIRNQ